MDSEVEKVVKEYQAWEEKQKNPEKWNLRLLKWQFRLLVPTGLREDGEWDIGANLPFPPELVLGLTGPRVNDLQKAFGLPAKDRYREWADVFHEVNWRFTVYERDARYKKEMRLDTAARVREYLERQRQETGVPSAPVFLLLAKAYNSQTRATAQRGRGPLTTRMRKRLERREKKLLKAIDALKSAIERPVDQPGGDGAYERALVGLVASWDKDREFIGLLDDLRGVVASGSEEVRRTLDKFLLDDRLPAQEEYQGLDAYQACEGIQRLIEDEARKKGRHTKKIGPQKRAREGLSLFGIEVKPGDIDNYRRRNT